MRARFLSTDEKARTRVTNTGITGGRANPPPNRQEGQMARKIENQESEFVNALR